MAKEAPAEDVSAGELAKAIEVALAELPQDQRSALVLRRYQDMPYEDIAVVLGTTLPAVKSLLFRARKTLRDKLAGWL